MTAKIMIDILGVAVFVSIVINVIVLVQWKRMISVNKTLLNSIRMYQTKYDTLNIDAISNAVKLDRLKHKIRDLLKYRIHENLILMLDRSGRDVAEMLANNTKMSVNEVDDAIRGFTSGVQERMTLKNMLLEQDLMVQGIMEGTHPHDEFIFQKSKEQCSQTK